MLKVNGGYCEAEGKPIELITDVCVAVEAVLMTLINYKKDSVDKEELIFGVVGAVIDSLNRKGEKIDKTKIGLALIAHAGKAGRE